ncbi:hypothetical protein [Deinococcus sp.]|uniref:hypothetical protein n=1 Tax=Deinococcus sp. TaxID=47478 RepID=UPI0025B7F491|nr:hypothetical protein [Deinococcus sp.]
MTRAPVNLSREMKLLLLLLLMVALIGLWYLLTNRSASDELANQPQPPPLTGAGPGDDTIPVTPGPPESGTQTPGKAPGAAAQPGVDVQSGVAVQPDAPMQVEVIPPFPTGESATDPTATDVPPSPSGINPGAALASVPGNNPFRPLQLDASASAGGGSGTPATVDTTPVSPPVSTSSAALPVTVPTNPDSFGSADGPLAITPLPGTSGGSVSGAGPLPVSPIPGGDGSTGSAASPVVVTPISGATRPVVITPGTGNGTAGRNGTGRSGSGGADSGGADSGSAGSGSGSGDSGSGGSGSGGTGSGGTGSGRSGSGGTGTEPTPAPIRPPVVGVSVPSVTRVPTLTPNHLNSSTLNPITPASGTGSSSGAAGAGGGTSAPVTGTPRPGTPQVITDLGSGNASVPTVNELDSFVQAQDLAFNAVVLGPVNTAIFRSRDGFVVVSVGQTLPDTKVTVKEVTATSATLSLGNNSKTLELDKR